MRTHTLISLLVLLVSLLSSTATADGKPIVAVFNFESKGISFQGKMLDRLSDYLAGSLAATGRYRIVPRSQLKKRLVKQKTASYKKCFDQSCQIEIGKELAAQRSVSSQVMKSAIEKQGGAPH